MAFWARLTYLEFTNIVIVQCNFLIITILERDNSLNKKTSMYKHRGFLFDQNLIN